MRPHNKRNYHKKCIHKQHLRKRLMGCRWSGHYGCWARFIQDSNGERWVSLYWNFPDFSKWNKMGKQLTNQIIRTKYRNHLSNPHRDLEALPLNKGAYRRVFPYKQMLW